MHPSTFARTSRLIKRCIISSTVPDRFNSNYQLRYHAAEGFREALPDTHLICVNFESLIHAVASLKPDLVILLGGSMLDQFDLAPTAHLINANGGKLVFWMHDDPYELDASFRVVPFAHAIFTTDKASVDHYPEHLPVFHLPLASSPTAHVRSIASRSGPDWYFCGFPFPNRVTFFRDFNSLPHVTSGLLQGSGWDLCEFSYAADIPVPNEQLPDYYAAASCVLNIGRSLNLANKRFGVRPSTPGPRTFEAAMAGAAQVAVLDGVEIGNYFSDDELLVASDASEFMDQVLRLKSDREMSRTLGKRAQARALAEHTYARRIEEMLSKLESI
jgi:spore maturation protein CgeB